LRLSKRLRCGAEKIEKYTKQIFLSTIYLCLVLSPNAQQLISAASLSGQVEDANGTSIAAAKITAKKIWKSICQ